MYKKSLYISCSVDDDVKIVRLGPGESPILGDGFDGDDDVIFVRRNPLPLRATQSKTRAKPVRTAPVKSVPPTVRAFPKPAASSVQKPSPAQKFTNSPVPLFTLNSVPTFKNVAPFPVFNTQSVHQLPIFRNIAPVYVQQPAVHFVQAKPVSKPNPVSPIMRAAPSFTFEVKDSSEEF